MLLVRHYCGRILTDRVPALISCRMLPISACRSRFSAWCVCLLTLGLTGWGAGPAGAYGPRGFDTVVIDAGHGGIDRGGGPGQSIPEKPYTLDTAQRLERELRRRGFRTVMTRREDVFVPLPVRTGIANAFRNAIFVSVHYNSAPRLDAHGFETYYYRGDSFGLATRLHRAQLATLDTEDRFVRRRGFFVLRRTAMPSVLLEGGFLTNPSESRMILNPSYRQRWAENVASAILAQSRQGDPVELGYQPPITSERLGSHRSSSHRSHGRSSRGRSSRGRSHGRSHGSSHGRSSHGSSSRRGHGSSSARHRRHR